MLAKLDPRNSIFARIFFAFWSMAILILAFVSIVFSFTTETYTQTSRAEQIALISALQDELVDAIAAGNVEQASDLLEGQARHIRDQFRIYDEFGLELLNRYAELENSFFYPASASNQPIVKETIEDNAGTQYTIYVRLQPRLSLLKSEHSDGVIFRALLSLIISLLGCYILAATLTKPIKELQHLSRIATANMLANKPLSSKHFKGFQNRHDEIGELANDIDSMTHQLAESYVQKQQVLQDIAHDLRGPLSRQSIALELLNVENKEQFHHLKTQLLHDHDELHKLIEQTLNLFRQGNQPLNKEQVNLTKLCQQIIKNARFEFPTIEFSLFQEALIMINADELLLKRAIENIIRNAGRFANHQVTLSLSLEKTAKSVFIIIKDDGRGVPEEALSQIFSPFMQIDLARTPEKHKGSGLGLAIAQQAIERHNGRINAENQNGLLMTIVLPSYNE